MATGDAGLLVNAQQSTTTRALPALFLGVNEFVEAVQPNELKVFNGAHSVTRAVSRIQLFQPTTRVFGAFETEPLPLLRDLITVSDPAGSAVLRH